MAADQRLITQTAHPYWNYLHPIRTGGEWKTANAVGLPR